MKIVTIGASKGIGRQTVKAALAAGHTVTAFSRDPSVLNIKHPKLKSRPGNVLDASSVEQAITGQDAVVCALGLPTLKAVGPPLARRSYVLSDGTSNILKAMKSQGVKRLICVTAIGAGDSVNQCTPLAKLAFRHGLKWLFQEKDRQEQLIQASQLDWTIIRPTALTNGPRRGPEVSENLHAGILTHVSRADVAAWITANLTQPATYREALTLSYPPRLGDSLRWLADSY